MEVRRLPEDLQKKAREELNEIPERVPENIRNVRKVLEDLKENLDDQTILTFLRGCKFDIDKTIEKLRFFHTLIGKSPEYFTARDPLRPEIQEILKRGIFLFLQNPEPTGPPILLVKWSKADPAQVPFKQLIKTALMGLDILMKEDDNFVICGQHILQDFEGFSMKYMMEMTPGTCRKLILFLQNAYPTRIKGMHFVNVPFYFRILHNIVNPFLSKKLQQRIKVYSEGFEGLEDIPLEALPDEYGGQAGPVQQISDNWRDRMENSRKLFENT